MHIMTCGFQSCEILSTHVTVKNQLLSDPYIIGISGFATAERQIQSDNDDILVQSA